MPRHFTDRDLALYRNRHGENIPVPPQRKKPSREESIAQCALIQWWDVACKSYGLPAFLLFAIPNGGKRGVVLGSILKREGVRSGVCDLMLAVPRGNYKGLFVEMKTETGKASKEQLAFIAEALRQGYMAGCAYGFDDAKRFIEAYLRGEEFL